MVTLDVSLPSPRSLEKAKLFFGEDNVTPHKQDDENYRHDTILDLIRARWGWLALFFVGLVLAAVVVEAFEEVLRQHVALSYFVPLLIGHGGNTGSQSNATVIRALALGHLRASDWMMVVVKESVTGMAIGGGLGALIYCVTYVWSGLDPDVGLTVALALPIVSCWANLLGGVFPLLSVRFGFNPAVTSAPLMTTVVDSTGLVIYFLIAKLVMGI